MFNGPLGPALLTELAMERELLALSRTDLQALARQEGVPEQEEAPLKTTAGHHCFFYIMLLLLLMTTSAMALYNLSLFCRHMDC
jgi:hypothetical protein